MRKQTSSLHVIGVANAQIELRTSSMGNRNLASFYRSPPLSNKLKPLVEVLEQSRGSSKIFGMPKGGLGRACLQSFISVLHVLLSSCYCPLQCMVVCCYPSTLLSGFAVNLNLVRVLHVPLLTAPRQLILPSRRAGCGSAHATP